MQRFIFMGKAYKTKGNIYDKQVKVEALGLLHREIR
jgi:hypothetical protein